MNTKSKFSSLREIIAAGFDHAGDKIIRQRVLMNRPLIVMRDGKVRKISAFVLAKERWGDDYSRYL